MALARWGRRKALFWFDMDGCGMTVSIVVINMNWVACRLV